MLEPLSIDRCFNLNSPFTHSLAFLAISCSNTMQLRKFIKILQYTFIISNVISSTIVNISTNHYHPVFQPDMLKKHSAVLCLLHLLKPAYHLCHFALAVISLALHQQSTFCSQTSCDLF